MYLGKTTDQSQVPITLCDSQFTATASTKYTDDMYDSNTQQPQVPSKHATCGTPIHSNHKYQVHTRHVGLQFTATTSTSTKYTLDLCDTNSQQPQVPSTQTTCMTRIHSNRKYQVHTRPVGLQFTATTSTKYTLDLCDTNSQPPQVPSTLATCATPMH